MSYWRSIALKDELRVCSCKHNESFERRQDGGLGPFVVANFLAGARFSYNVSRNAINQSIDKLQTWKSNAGKPILERIAASVITALDKAGVNYRWRDLWTGSEKETAFSTRGEWIELENFAQ